MFHKSRGSSEASVLDSPRNTNHRIGNGVKMTGMPAFAPTHSERELWSMVAFLEKLKAMTPGQYKAFSSSAAEPQDEHNNNESSPPRHHHKMSE